MNASIIYEEVKIKIGSIVLKGNLRITENSEGIVLFSHGSGSSRFSVRNRYVADYLNDAGIATLLVDLLTEEEDKDYMNRFDIDLLTTRLVFITEHLRDSDEFGHFTIGYFGSSTGAASALRAAAQLRGEVQAVVSRGGRPDLAAGVLGMVEAPTLLIVGSLDKDVIILNRRAYKMLVCKKQIEIVEGAGHLFEEPGKLAEVSRLASDWFVHHLQPQDMPVLNH